ncbi:MAG: spore maturation protein [Anaeroplasma sp.]
MANKIFVGIMLVALGYAALTNRADAVIEEILSSPKDAFFVFIDIYALLIFWGGILRIIKDSGLLDVISKYISKLIHPLFKNLDVESDAMKYISMNFVANMLSMGSAATPFGLKAMEELNKINNNSDTASNEMVTFLLINTSGLCLIPTTLLSIRTQFGSENTVAIIPWIVLVSTICTISAIFLDIGVRKLAKY